ncbi:DUF4184 family protein [Apibacter sp. HY039]|uniref:DUF4184 family protein n=1 Tax=Apibacter sp. HY039 TaxID=2501476 RepID=UPI000FEB7936|nr:DUF4184 family protein [Apibacter sp. HY039]
MPFTFSHPALILPLKSCKYFSFTGLVLGSMSPDFEYFISMQVIGKQGHTLAGIFYMDLPLCLLFAFLYHQLIRNPLIDHLPLFIKSKVYKFKSFNWIVYWKNHKIQVIFSILLGTFSHLFWDAFTHFDGYFVTKLSILQGEVSHIPVYKLLQHISTLLGAILICWSIIILPDNKCLNLKSENNYWHFLILWTIIFTCIRFVLEPEKLAIGNMIVTPIFVAFIGTIVIGCYSKFIKPAKM